MATLSAIAISTLGLMVLLALSGFFSGSETALMALTRTQARRMAQGTTGERCANRLLRDPQRLFNTIVISNMVVNILFASIIARVMQQTFGGSGVGIAAFLSTVLLLLFGEVTPKTLAVQRAGRFARFVSPILYVLAIVLTPFRFLTRIVITTILRLLGQRPLSGWAAISMDDIESMVTLGAEEGVTSSYEKELLHNVMQLADMEAREIMIPRPDIVAVPDSKTVAEAFDFASEKRHSRIPIYTENMDDIWGIFSVIDMPGCRDKLVVNQKLADLGHGYQESNGADVYEGMPVYSAAVFPETVSVEYLLQTMRKNKYPMVILVDEYGGTAGMLTIDDILEGLIGRISYSGDSESRGGYLAEGESVLLEGALPLRDLQEKCPAELGDTNSDTVGGYAMELLGRLPRAGDCVEDENLRLQIIKMAGARIDTLRVERKETAAE